MTDVRQRRVRLVPASLEQLDAYFRDPAELEAMLGSKLPTGWPLDANAFLWVANAMETAPHLASRLMVWTFDEDTGRMVGDCGYRPKGDGVVELLYEIAGEFRGQGYATAMMTALIRFIFADPEIVQIDVRPMAGDAKSTGVLRRTGFVPPLGDTTEMGIWSLTRDDLADLERH